MKKKVMKKKPVKKKSAKKVKDIQPKTYPAAAVFMLIESCNRMLNNYRNSIIPIGRNPVTVEVPILDDVIFTLELNMKEIKSIM